MKNQNTTLRQLAAIAALAMTASSAFAASQTWTNAPADNTWANVGNWNAKAVPGALNVSGNTVNADIVTFTNPIPLSGIGGSGAPNLGIVPDGSASNARAREIAGITFDGPTCGAYFIGTNNSVVPASFTNGVLYVSHNQAIRINPPVATTQTILEPLVTILPSSTAGKFSLINNSTNNAALIISYIQHGGAATRATTFILDGTNTANNCVTNLSEGGGNGTGGFTKQGAGKWAICGPGTFPAASPLNVNDGTLITRDPAAFGVATTCFVNSNGVLQIDGVTPNQAALNLTLNGKIRANGAVTVNGVTIASSVAGINPGLATTSSGDVFTIGNASTKLIGGAADTTLHISGPGTVLLAYDASTYIGKMSVDAGTAQLGAGTSQALGTGANVNIAAGATLDITPLGAASYNLSTAAISGSGTGTGGTAAKIIAGAAGTLDLATGAKSITLTFTPTSFSGDTAHPSLYLSQGTLAMGGNAFTINNASGTALGNGTYVIIQQASGSITDGGGYSVSAVTGSGVVAGSVASVSVSGGNVNLVVSPYVPKNLVWTGGAANANWNIATDANWLNGLTPIIFNNSDNVTFNSVGLTNPTVSLAATLAPGSVTVDAASTYTFAGSGSIAGQASLLKKNSGALVLNTANTYSGGTVVSNGTIQFGINNAISGTGAGDVSVVNSGKVDLFGFNGAINGLNGNGAVDVTGGGSSTLSLGNNGNSGAFSGALQNSAGTLAVTKNGTGTQTLSGANTYVGATTITVGTLKVTHPNALGSGASAVTVGSTLDVATNLNVASIAGSGNIVNNSNTTTNQLNVLGASTWGGNIADGSGGGGVSVLVSAGTLTYTAANSYSGGSIVANGAALRIGNTGSFGSGGIIASNNATVGMNNANNPSGGFGNSVTTVDGATVVFTGGGNQANNYTGQFIGGLTATNVLTNAFSIGGATSFASFNGTVIVGPSTSMRWFNGAGGGDAATFDFEGGNVFSRDANTIRLGALQGGSQSSSLGSPSVSAPATYIVGGKNLSTTFSGGIGTSNNIVKAGTGSLTLNGMNVTTNTDNATYTNYLYAPIVNYWGSTVVSNGTLAVIAPDSLTNSSSITLAGAGAVLDASKIGWASNYVDSVSSQNVSDIITNGILNLAALVPLTGGAQSLSGLGSITGQLVADAGTTVSPGLPTGALSVSGNITLNSVNFNTTFNRTNSPNCGELAAAGASTITVNGGTLTVVATNDDLVKGDVFHVFNKAAIGNFAVTNLPASNVLNTISYVFSNRLTIDGTLVVVQGASAVNPTPTNITASISGTTLTLNWPADHTGWRLQSQTNALGSGLGSGWSDVAGSTTVHTLNFTIDPAKPTVFYRMVYP